MPQAWNFYYVIDMRKTTKVAKYWLRNKKNKTKTIYLTFHVKLKNYEQNYE